MDREEKELMRDRARDRWDCVSRQQGRVWAELDRDEYAAQALLETAGVYEEIFQKWRRKADGKIESLRCQRDEALEKLQSCRAMVDRLQQQGEAEDVLVEACARQFVDALLKRMHAGGFSLSVTPAGGMRIESRPGE